MLNVARKYLEFLQPQFSGLFGGGGSSNGADQAAEQERQRQVNVTNAISGVNDKFAGFDDNYYANLSKAYLDHYAPLLDEQYGEAARKLPLQFSSTGNSEFSRTSGNLDRDYQRQKVDLNDQATGYANTQRQNIENQRSGLTSLASSTGGSANVATQAAALAKALATPAPFNPLGDLFAKYSGNAANATIAANSGYGSPNAVQPLTFGSTNRSNIVSG